MPDTPDGYVFEIRDGASIFKGPGAFSKKVVSNSVLSPQTWDAGADDVANALNNRLRNDGVSRPTADLNLNGHKITDLADATGSKDAVNQSQLDAAVGRFFTAAEVGSQANALVITPTTPLTAAQLVAGLLIRFFVKTENTTAVSLNISGLGAKALQKPDGTAIGGGELEVGAPVVAMYTGSVFRLVGGFGTTGASSTPTGANRAVSILGAGTISSATSTVLLTTSITPRATASILQVRINLMANRARTLLYDINRRIGTGSWTAITPNVDGGNALALLAHSQQGAASGPRQVELFDAPNTTSAVSYRLRAKHQGSGGLSILQGSYLYIEEV